MFCFRDSSEERIDGLQGCQELVLVTEGEGEVQSLTLPHREPGPGEERLKLSPRVCGVLIDRYEGLHILHMCRPLGVGGHLPVHPEHRVAGEEDEDGLAAPDQQAVDVPDCSREVSDPVETVASGKLKLKLKLSRDLQREDLLEAGGEYRSGRGGAGDVQLTEADVVRRVVLLGVGDHLLGHVTPHQSAGNRDGLIQQAGGHVPGPAAHVQDVLLLLPGH